MVAPALPRYCPGCGGPSPDRGGPCTYCGVPLVPLGTPDPRHAIRCSECATAVPDGSSFCAACGNALASVPTGASSLTCPGCGDTEMLWWGIAPNARRPSGFPVHGCRGCGGAWVDANTLQAVLEAASVGAHMEGHGTGDRNVRRRTLAPGTATAPVIYRRCPTCTQTMARKNFARVSGVVVDACITHGTFFDAGELEDVLAFVRSGGLALAKRREDDERASLQRSQLTTAAMQAEGSAMGPAWMDGYQTDPASRAFFSWAGRWVRGLFR